MSKIKSFCENVGCFFCSFKAMKELKNMDNHLNMGIMQDSDIDF